MLSRELRLAEYLREIGCEVEVANQSSRESWIGFDLWFSKSNAYIEEVDATLSGEDGNVILAHLKNSPKLERLTIKNFSGLDAYRIISRFSNLTVLVASDSELLGNFSPPSSLRQVYLFRSSISLSALQSLITNQSIDTLSIVDCHADHSLFSAISNSNSIRDLVILPKEPYWLGDSDIAALARIPSLRKLEIHGYSGSGEIFSEFNKRGRKLDRLVLGGHNLTEVRKETIRDAAIGRNCLIADLYRDAKMEGSQR